jgi:APA family basic amino acid/polyamine antiporter
VSNVIGGGIFFVPLLVAGMVPNPIGFLSVWVIGGLLSFTGAMAYAELAALRPRAGGEYVYLREAFGPIAAFLTGWTSFVAGFSGAIAASAVGLAGVLGRFVPMAGDTRPMVSVPLGLFSLDVSPQSLFALLTIALLSVVHLCGLGPGKLVQNGLATLKVSALVAFVLIGFAIGNGSMGHLSSGGAVPMTGLVMALIPVMFTYSGWNAAAYVAEEIRDPERNVPRALAIGTASVIAIYLFLNLLYVYAMPLGDLAKLPGGILDATAERLFGFIAANWLAAFSIVSIAASISAMVIAGPRVYFAMARDGVFPEAVARVHPRFRTPATAIVAQAVWSSVLVLSGTLSQLVNYTGFAVVLFSGIAVASLFVLRQRHPGEPRPFRAWGYPTAPAIFVLAAAVMLIGEFRRTPGPVAAGLGIILLGVPLYFVFRRR